MATPWRRAIAPRERDWLRSWRQLAWVVAAVSTACDPFGTEFAPVEDAQLYTAGEHKPAPRPAALRVMNYNVKFGGGRLDFFFDCHGDRVLMTRDEVIENLERLADVIAQVDPDVLVLQEVDVRSKRAAYVDELQWLLDHTEMNFGAYASQWRADFVPSDGIGPVDSGNAILSRWPIHDAQRLALPLRSDLSGLDKYFYLRRNILRAHLEIPGQPSLAVLAIHAEAYAQDGTKRAHVQRFEAELDAAAVEGPVLGVGDLNTLPPGSKQTSNFDDSACTDTYLADDYSEEGDYLTTLFEHYASDLSLEDYARDNARYFSHTTLATGFWNRRLDYLFTNLIVRDGQVYQSKENGGIDTMPVSDHAPVAATLEFEE